MTNSKRKASRWILIAIAIFWSGSIVVGSWAMLRHEYDGSTAFLPAPSMWPAELNAYSPSADGLTLVMAVHPGCPCTRASIEQLDRFLARHPGKANAIALFFDDEAVPSESLDENDYWRRLERMPFAQPLRDPDGRFAEQLGALSSGSVAAYDGEGRLRFQGGLTSSRGHAGSSFGLTALNEIARGGASLEVVASPVFGCSLQK